MSDIQGALAKMDPTNENHWTSEGLPRLETVRFFAGNANLSREQVTQAAPQFSRATAQATPAAAPPVPALPPVVSAAVNVAGAGTVQEQPPIPSVSAAASTEGLPPQQALMGNPHADIAPPTPEETASLEAQLATLTEELEDISRAEVEIAKAKKLRNDAADDLRVRIGKLQPRESHSNQHAIMAYLASQARIREHRAAQIGHVRAFEKEAGFKLADLLPKRAPIDQAMARPSGYGKKRPGT